MPISRFEVMSRAVLRRLRVLPVLSHMVTLLRPSGDDYEAKFAALMLAAVEPGDDVWDVGANIGFYTRQLSVRVGSSGRVCAFEPAPHCLVRLKENVVGLENVEVVPVGLGDIEDTRTMELTDAPEAGTHRIIADDATGESTTVNIPVVPGDTYRRRENRPVPQLVKIDVEGFEEEVIMGMVQTIRHQICRAVFCEVHFSILDSRGKMFAPVNIEKRLQSYGFGGLQWIDHSHLMAVK